MLESEVVKILNSLGIKTTEEELETPPQEEFGDLSYPCFHLSKEQKRNPVEIAKELVAKIRIPKGSLIEKVESMGPYLNFFFKWQIVARRLLKNVSKWQRINIGKKKNVMIEFSQPNTAHGLHIGHARTTMLGESLANIMNYAGFHTIKANYYGDFGVQVSKSIVAYMKWGKDKKIDKKSDLWMWDLYIKFHEETSKDPQLEEEAKDILRRLENGDKKTILVWKKVRKIVLDGIKQTYRRLGVSFDVEFYESQFYKLGRDVVKDALKKGVAKESEGAVVTDLEKYSIPNTVLIKSDGTTLYQTRDIGLAIKNFKDYKLTSRVYVVDVRQSLHFIQVFKILELLGYKWSENLYHLGYGFVSLPEGLMASRSGKVVILDEFLDELKELAYKQVQEHNPSLSEKVKRNLAENIGKSALIFSILKIEPEQNIVFNKDEMLKFEGYTGPYLQYSHTRCSNIIKKAGKWEKNFVIKEMTNEEKKLVKTLVEFPKVIEEASISMRPHYVCNYAYNLSTAFNNFYEKCNVLKSENKIREFRLTLVDATRNILNTCLKLLGITPVDKM